MSITRSTTAWFVTARTDLRRATGVLKPLPPSVAILVCIGMCVHQASLRPMALGMGGFRTSQHVVLWMAAHRISCTAFGFEFSVDKKGYYICNDWAQDNRKYSN